MEPTQTQQVTFDRTYDAPLDTVWQAWTDPEKLKQWWGPENVSVPECEVDLRVGGRFYIVMVADEAMGEYKGTRWPMEAAFTTVEAPAKLVYSATAWTEGHKETTSIEQTQELTLTEEDGKTKLHVIATLTKVGPDAGMAAAGMKYGYTQQLEKLATFLAQ